MRSILLLWGFSMVFFWGWYGLSAHDISMGTTFFSRQMHDLMFGIYGKVLGMEPEAVPLLVAKAFAVDTVLVFGIAALRWYKNWLPQTKSWVISRLPIISKRSASCELAATENALAIDFTAIDLTKEPVIGPMRPAE